jgi:hypothetical protein
MQLKPGYEAEQHMTGRLVGFADAREAVQSVREGRRPTYSDEI